MKKYLVALYFVCIGAIVGLVKLAVVLKDSGIFNRYNPDAYGNVCDYGVSPLFYVPFAVVIVTIIFVLIVGTEYIRSSR
ncbi:hypothetical protein J6X15_01270 [Candidatus Saccharibacteria bacterium]|nr:hypothetical protein [Candidatus Saccharibacteria bacterium]